MWVQGSLLTNFEDRMVMRIIQMASVAVTQSTKYRVVLY